MPGQVEPLPAQKDAPYFFDLDIEIASAGDRTIEVEGLRVAVHTQVLDGLVWLAECRYALDASPERNRVVQEHLKARLRQDVGYTGTLLEEYRILLIRRDPTLRVPGTPPTPEEFVQRHRTELAGWLRSHDKALGEAEVAEMLDSRAQYSQSDLTLVEWEGAVVSAEDGDFQSDIELMKIGNYQLLRYRMLDQTIEGHLRFLRRHVSSTRGRWLLRSDRRLQEIVEQRLSLLLDFEKTDQSLLLIGDWYSARVYRLITEQFCLEEWKKTVSAKLDSLTAIENTVRENLTLSWRRLIDFVTMAGWAFLLVGYLVLFFLGLR